MLSRCKRYKGAGNEKPKQNIYPTERVIHTTVRTHITVGLN